MALLKRSDIKRKPKLKPGTYAFQVIRAESKVSQSGNDMFKVVVRDIEGAGTISYFIVLIAKLAYQLLDFCEAANLQLPEDDEAELILERVHFEGRYVYGQVVEDPDDDERTFVRRIMTRDEALKKAPRLASVSMPENPLCIIPVVRPGSLPPAIKPTKSIPKDDNDDIPF
jgi:hypothetical protein